jgi:hypothetical protein
MEPPPPSHRLAVSVRLLPPREADPITVVEGSRDVRIGAKIFRGFSSTVTGSDQEVAYAALGRPIVEQLRRGYSCTFLAYGQTGSGKTYTVFGPPGSLTQQSLEQAAGGVPRAWGLFPRVVLEILQAGLGTMHASAVEIYQDAAYDLLDGRRPLTVGSKHAGLAVGGGPSCVHTLGVATQGAAGAGLEYAGVHPPACRCGKCFLAKKEALAARLAKRDQVQEKGAARAPPTSPRGKPSPSNGSSFATVGRRSAHSRRRATWRRSRWRWR